MNLIKTLIFSAIVIAGTYSLNVLVFAASVQHKPQSPLQISIAPAQPGLALESIKAGDVVEFKVVATSMLDATEMRISVDLIDGAELVSGDLSWTGLVGKKEEKQLVFSVRVPSSGIGKIHATLTVMTEGAKPLSRMTQYSLLTGEQQRQQLEDKKKLEKTNRVRKDSRGKNVVEYR